MSISNKVGLCLGQFEAQFTVAISNVGSSRLGCFEGIFIVAISDLVCSRLGHFEGKIHRGHKQRGMFLVR